jgi:hypothetical protein
VGLSGNGDLAAVRAWLSRHHGITDVQLGAVKGVLMETALGVFFMWHEGKRTDLLPWDDAVKRFGLPRLV